jgi:hypothetical protein
MADVQPDSEEEEEKEFVEKLSQWRKGDISNKKKKVRYIYKSVDDVLEQGKTTSSGKREYRYECVKICIWFLRFEFLAPYHSTFLKIMAPFYL